MARTKSKRQQQLELGAPDLRGLQPADALLVLQPGETRLGAGESVPVVLL